MRTAIVLLGLCLVAACGSADTDSDTVVPVVETGTINQAEGAFTRNPGTETDASGSVTVRSDPVPTDASDASEDDDGSNAADGVTTTVDGDGEDPPESTTAGTTASGNDTAASTTAPPASGDSLGIGEGLVRIDDVDHPFVTDLCDVDDSGFFIFGTGTSSGGDPFEIDISGDTIDLDGDGTDDLNFDLVVTYDGGSNDSSSVPEFYASKVVTSTFTEGEDVTVTVDGSSVSGSGPIEDFNEVAAAAGTTLPMTFAVRCG